MKFVFKSKFQGFGSPENTMEFEVDSLDDVLMYFEQFLRGAGYSFDGQLEFVSHDDYSNYDEDFPVAGGGSDYIVDYDNLDQSSFSWTADQLAKMPQSFVVNPSEAHVNYDVSGQGKHINLTINEEVTSLSKTVCPVCKLPTATMQNYTCYDKNCGMK